MAVEKKRSRRLQYSSIRLLDAALSQSDAVIGAHPTAGMGAMETPPWMTSLRKENRRHVNG